MLIGRDEDLARLRFALTTPAGAAVVFLDGAVGVGKTALLSRLLADRDLPRVLFARPAETPAHIPLDGVRGIVETLLDDDLPALLAEGTPMRTLRLRVRAALKAASLVVVDDVQWLDPDSLDLLLDLLSQPTRADVSFLFVHRTSFTPERLSRAAARGGLSTTRISLDPLGDEDAHALLEHWGPVDPSILQLAEGNPLFLRLLAEGIRTVADPSDPAALVEAGLGSLDDTLLTEITTLPTPARTLLHALSLEPAPPPSALPALTGLTEAALTEGAARLSAHGLTDPLQLEILHPLIRAAAYRDMDVGTRRTMHRAAAARMNDPIDRAVHLRHLGAHLTEDELDALLEAAARVMATAPRSARNLLEKTRRIPRRDRDLLLARALLLDGHPRQAEELLLTLSGEEDATREAVALLIQSLRIQGRPDEAVELVREVTDWEQHPEVAVEAATLMVMHEQAQDAALIQKAAGLSDSPGVSTALAALTALAHLRHGDVALAREPYALARDGFLSIAGTDLLPVIDAVTAAGWSAHMVGDFEGGVAFVERAIQLAERNGRFHALPHLYSILAFLCIPLDRGTEAGELVAKAIDAAERYDWPDVVPLATTAGLVAAPDRATTERWYRSLAALDLPQTWWWRRVASLFRARVEIRFGIPIDPSVLAEEQDVFAIQNHIGLGELSLLHGDLASAQQQASRAEELAERFRVPYLSGQALQFRAEVRRAEGRRAEAEATALAAAELFAEAGAPLYVRNVRSWLRRHAAPADGATPAATEAGQQGPVLTPRELSVAELVADGLSNREIAERLHLSIRTVESHVARILRKRGLRSRAGLARNLDAR